MVPLLNSIDEARLTPESVALSVRGLPSAPKILPRLYRLLRDGDASLQEIGRLIRLDPGLTARVLHLGNELLSARGEHCFTVEDAINQIGCDRVYRVVSEIVSSQVIVRPVSVYGLDAEELWRYSVLGGISAELIAELTGEDTSLAYTVGLLHSVGMIAVDSWALSEGPSLMFVPRGLPREYTESERALLGFTHADVGAALLQSWGFPASIVEPVRYQYAPRSCGGYTRSACLLQAAKWLRSVVFADDEAPPPTPVAVVLQPLRLTAERLVRLVVDVRVRMGEVRNDVELVAA